MVIQISVTAVLCQYVTECYWGLTNIALQHVHKQIISVDSVKQRQMWKYAVLTFLHSQHQPTSVTRCS